MTDTRRFPLPTDDSQPTFARLAQEANEHHHAAESLATEWFRNAVIVGEALIAVQHQLPDDAAWNEWVTDNLDFARHQAASYMRVAFYKESFDPSRLPPTLSEARQTLRWKARRASGHPTSPELAQEVLSLRQAGQSWRAIGNRFGLNHKAVAYLVDPLAYKRERDRVANINRRTYQAKKALEREEGRRITRSAGGNLSAAYGYIRQALQAIDGALADSENREIRSALASALAAAHHAEDHLVVAARKSRVAA